MRYEIIDHTADIGLKAYGKDENELFVNAAYGMFDIIADLSVVSAKEEIEIKCEAKNYEELLVNWLSELLYQYSSKDILFSEFYIDKISDNYLIAKAFGEKLDLTKHQMEDEIKAVTYHQLKVEKTDDTWTAEVIFDV